ncbi:MAG: hypothetical protein HY700_03765 [Gemmatimonadetes bacterium]|nr:hypothetical protein [Gemmatimonadota bacterium]
MFILSIVVGGSFAGCAKEEKPPARPEMTQRQRDSAIGESKLPGAAGVRGALRAADSAQARQNQLDSLEN